MSDEPGSTERGHPRTRLTFLAVSAGLSILITAVAALGMGTYLWAREQLPEIDIRGGAGGSQGAPPDIAFEDPCAEEGCNYLLLGSDSRAGLTPQEKERYGSNEHIGGEFRSDTIIVVHTVPDRARAVILHFPRDLWVQIPGVGPGKINSAFRAGVDEGGPELVAKTIKRFTGLQIHHVMYVNLAGFQGVVDALGGVPMCVNRALHDQLAGLDIPRAGCYEFDGATALAYVRARHLPGDCVPDFARISRQQQFLRALLSKILSPGQIVHLPSLVRTAARNVKVDPGLRDLTELAFLVRQLEGVSTGAADFRVVPSRPATIYPSGVFTSIVELVQPAADRLFVALRKGRPLGNLGKDPGQDTAPSPANIRIGVYDRGSAGAAQEVLSVLQRGGFDTSPGLSDASSIDLQGRGSVLLYRPATRAMADVVHGYLPSLPMREVPGGLLAGSDVAAVVAPGYEAEPPGGGGAGAPAPSCPA